MRDFEFIVDGVEGMHLLCGLTFELSGRQRQDARPGLAKMYRVPPDRAWWPAVGAPLERGVRPHSAACGRERVLDGNLLRKLGLQELCPSPWSIAFNTDDEVFKYKVSGNAYMVDAPLEQLGYFLGAYGFVQCLQSIRDGD